MKNVHNPLLIPEEMWHQIFVFGGASGSGKNFFSNLLFRPEQKLRTATSRVPRYGEKHEVDYFFKTEQAFKKGIDCNEFVEWDEFAGIYYGLPKEELSRKLGEDHVYIILTANGIRRYKELFPKNISIFLDIDINTAIQNMKQRGDTLEQIERRVQKYEEESASKDICDYVILNDKEKTEENILLLKEIILKEKKMH